MKKVLLLGGAEQQIVAINTAKRLGLFTILCDYLPNNPGKYHADKFYLISTTDKEEVLRVARIEEISGIIAYASDPAAPTAAYVAEKMGLPTNPYKSVEILCNKDLFREYLKERGYNVPHSRGYSNRQQAIDEIKTLNFPVIIKPVDSSGSKGITVLHSKYGAAKAIDFAFSFSKTHRIIVENYIEKKHPYLIGGDIFISNGSVILWGLMNCHRDNQVNELVPVGKSYPLLLSDQDLKAVKKTLQKLISDLGIKFGPMNVELIVDNLNRVFLIDIGPRSGGNMIPDLLGVIFNCDLVEMSLKSAIGQPDNYCIIRSDKEYLASYNLHSKRNGVLNRIEFTPKIKKYIIGKRIYKKKGDEVHFFSNASDALGIIFLQFPDKKTMLEIEDHMNEYVRVILQGEDS